MTLIITQILQFKKKGGKQVFLKTVIRTFSSSTTIVVDLSVIKLKNKIIFQLNF